MIIVKPCFFIGYHPTCSYKLYNPKKKKVIYGRDVQFDELKYWKDKDNQKEQATVRVQVPMENSVRHQDEAIPHGEGNVEQITEQISSGRMRRMPVRLKDYHMFPNSAITDEGEFVNIALMAATEPVKF